jgi:NADH-quinone oxidoreductase subunit J
VITARNPVASAMALVGSFFALAGIYVLLWAHTIAILQVLVYAGAIMVLFLFVIMLLSLGEDQIRGGGFSVSKVIGGLATGGLLLVLALAIIRMNPGGTTEMASLGQAEQAAFGTLAHLGQVLYTRWLFPFEAVSLLLLAAMVGAVVVAKSRI